MRLLRQTYPSVNTASDPSDAVKKAAAMDANIYKDVGNVVNALSFGDPSNLQNMAGYWFQNVTPVAADTEFIVVHNLNYIPTGYIVFSVDQAAVIYKGVTPWTATTISLKCNMSTVNIVIFVT